MFRNLTVHFRIEATQFWRSTDVKNRKQSPRAEIPSLETEKFQLSTSLTQEMCRTCKLTAVSDELGRILSASVSRRR